MNKAELINHISEGTHLSKAEAAKALDAFTGAVKKALKRGDKVTLVGFGTYSVGKRNARTGRNPKTGKPIKIPAKKVVKFKAGKGLADSVR